MSAHVLIVDLAAAVLAVIGFHMAFRQRLVLRWIAAWRGRPGRAERPEGEDPAHYALIIFGMMLLAFAVIIAAFTTAFDLMTP